MTAELALATVPSPAPAPVDAPVPRVLVRALDGAASSLVEGLRQEGVAVLVAPDGRLVDEVLRGGLDAVVLHAHHAEARSALAELRAATPVPVVVALRDPGSAMEELFEAGADDCVTSTVSRSELAARIRAVVRRRSRPATTEVLRAGSFVMDLARHVFLHDDRPVHLSPKEFGLLELLIRRDGRVVSREEALDLVWGMARGSDATTVDVHVKRLRAKIERDPARPERLITVRGLGYRFMP